MSAQDDEIKFLKKLMMKPRRHTPDGIVAIGDAMTPELLSYAYERGVFPWPHEGYPLLWFCPEERGVLDFKDLHLPKSFQKWLRQNKNKYQVTMNNHFRDVILGCQKQKRQNQSGTWITEQMIVNYTALFEKQQAFSVEIWKEENLVGGLYGVKSRQYYSCESMFHLEDNVSKLALYSLVLQLQTEGLTWVDIQMVTDVCRVFGGKLIDKNEFLNRIGF